MHHCFVNPDAIAHIHGGKDHPHLIGEARFYQKGDCVLIKVRVCGLPHSDTGFFALHIHEGCSCTGEDFSETGGHYNPQGNPHPQHAGDLPPLLQCGYGAYLETLTDRFCVSDIIGKTLVIHGGPDDFSSQPAGNAGKKIACGIICRK